MIFSIADSIIDFGHAWGLRRRAGGTGGGGALGPPGEQLAAETDIWLIEYRETQAGTVVRGAADKDIPSHGRVWIDSRTGRFLRTELISEDTDVRALIDVSYRAEAGLDLLVPHEMRETYELRRTLARIDGRATYGRFRQFTVTTSEKPKG